MMGPSGLADQVLRDHWDGSLPVPLGNIANGLGIAVYLQDELDCSGVISKLDVPTQSGYTIQIVVNNREPVLRQRFTVAHEIGHFVLGHLNDNSRMFRDRAENFSSKGASVLEAQANRFAAALLMPADLVRTAWGSSKISTIEQMADAFQVSTLAMVYRLTNMGLYRP